MPVQRRGGVELNRRDRAFVGVHRRRRLIRRHPTASTGTMAGKYQLKIVNGQKNNQNLNCNILISEP